MKIKLLTQLSIIVFASIVGLQSCSDSDNDPVAGGREDLAKTDRGTPDGNATSKSIGAAGGELTSADGRITVTIPANALSAAMNVFIQPISNLSPLSLGSAYRLSPEGTTFAQPVKLTFHYDPNEIGASSGEDFLWITTQDTDGVWNGMLKSEVDKTNHTVSVETTHFSDWSMGRFIELTLIPAEMGIPVNKNLTLAVTGFKATDDQIGTVDRAPLVYYSNPEDGDLVALAPIPKSEGRRMAFKVKQWTLNGSAAPVSNANGKLAANNTAALYTAPAKKPNPSVVAVTAQLETSDEKGKTMAYYLVSNITIIDGDYYLHVNFKGVDYTYYQYGFNGLPAPQGQFEMVNAGRDDDGNIGIAAGAYDHDVVTDVFLASFKMSSTGGRRISCFHEDNNGEEVSFTSSVNTVPYQSKFGKRTKINDSCDTEGQCAQITFNLTQYSSAAFGEITGTVSGVLYLEDPSNDENCTTPEPVPFSGDFKLVVVN